MNNIDQNAAEDTILATWLIFTEGMTSNFFQQGEIHYIYDRQPRTIFNSFNKKTAPPQLFELLAQYYYSQNTVSLANKQKILENTFVDLYSLEVIAEGHLVADEYAQQKLEQHKTMLEHYHKSMLDLSHNHKNPQREVDAENAKRIQKSINDIERFELYRIDVNDYVVHLLKTLIDISSVHCHNLETAMHNQMNSLHVNVPSGSEIPEDHSNTRADIKRVLAKRVQPAAEVQPPRLHEPL